MRYVGYKKYLYFLFMSICISMPSSCTNYVAQPKMEFPESYSRLLVYLHLEGSGKSSIDFTLKGAFIENLDSGKWEPLLGDSIEISSKAIGGGQVKIAEVLVDPASYGKVRLDVSSASLLSSDGSKRDLLVSEESFYFNAAVKLKNGESHVLQLAWNSDGSLSQGNIFEPVINVKRQVPAVADLAIFVSNSKSNYVSVIDKDLERVVGAITVGRGPKGMALNRSSGRLYVVNSEDSTVSVVDIYSYEVISVIDIASYGVDSFDSVFIRSDINTFEGKLYVLSKATSDVMVIDTETVKVVKVLPVGVTPNNMVLSKSRNEIYITNEGSNSITILSGINDIVTATVRLVQSPQGVAVDGNKIYVFNGDAGVITIVSSSTRTIVGDIPTLSFPIRGVKSYDEKLYTVNSSTSTISVFDSLDGYIEDIKVGKSPNWIAVDSVKHRIFISNYGDDTVSIMDPVEQSVTGVLQVGKNPYSIVISERE